MSLFDCATKKDLNGIIKIAKERGLDHVKKRWYLKLNSDLRSNNILHIGCQLGFMPLVDYALELFVEVNIGNVAGDSPLILATRNGHLDIVKKLIAAGSLVNHANNHGNTALHYACFWRFNDIALYLVKTCGALVKVSNNFNRLPTDQTNIILKGTLIDIGIIQGGQIVHGKDLITAVKSNDFNLAAEWNIDPSELQILEVYAESPSSVIYNGVWNNSNIVIKVPRLDRSMTDQELQTLRHEIGGLKKLAHPNLNTILSASIAKDWNICYLMNIFKNGDLQAMISSPLIDITPKDAIKYCIQIAKGLLYLHESNPAHAHGNLKLSNVQNDGTLVLTDYGFKRSILNNRIYEPLQIYQPEWLAPEILMGALTEDDRAADVYVFGLICYSIITRQPLFEAMNPMVLGYLIAIDHLTPTIPAFIPTVLVSMTNKAGIMTKCWNASPSGRPPLRLMYNQLLQYNF